MSLGRLNAGLVVARSIVGVTIAKPPYVDDGGLAWLVPVTIAIGSSSAHVPATTSWLLRVGHGYPFGSVDLYPSATGSVNATFQHQDLNIIVPSWRYRLGKLCLDNPYRLKMLASEGNDPVGDADNRVAWYLRRAVEWLERAATGDLARAGEPFEVPRCVALRERIQVVHDESRATFGIWSARERSWGRIIWRRPRGVEKTLVAARFLDGSRHVIREASSTAFEVGESHFEGIWWLWPKPITVSPWQVPHSWAELREVAQSQQIDVDRTLRSIAASTRGGGPVVLMLGYPMPTTWDGDAVEIHWQAVEIFAFERGKPANGFRANEAGWWQRDRATKFRGSDLVIYANTENWHPDRLQARGRVASELTAKKVAIIGCGALGSSLAELLVRGGVHRMLLVDGDPLEAGNLVRHVLTAKDVGKNKAEALAAMLSVASPLADIRGCSVHLPSEPQQVHDLLDDCDVVVDCTATNDVPALLASTWWSIAPVFVSASVGFEAQRTFLYRVRANAFTADDFLRQLAPWLAREQAAWSTSGELVEGVGCYSPLFRARLDDIKLAAIASLRFIESACSNASNGPELLVLEKTGLAGLAPAVLLAAEFHAAAV
jgi:hypothetical protein